MNCNEKEDLLIDYLEGILEHEEKDRLESHLSSCQKCQTKLAKLKKVRSLLRQWNPVNPPDELKQKVMDNLKALTLIEEKANKELKDTSTDDVLEWLRKRVKSEQIRIYKVLTDFLGIEKGEKVFDYYLEEQLKEQMTAPPKGGLGVISSAIGFDVEFERLENGTVKETIRNCPYISMAHELGMKVSPCEAICVRAAKVREKFQPIKLELVKKLPNEEGLCIFLSTPLESRGT
ncbi:MAG: zf-HC2 domain-containing protein [Proteobacteria bacterium]|nr:zf-HC2 domain-containing protein [Pseudomonadota bacterium]